MVKGKASDKGYLYCCGAFGVAPEDPKYEAPPMPDSPVDEDLGDEEVEDEETEKSLDDILAEKTTDEGTSSQKVPYENTTDKITNLTP